MLQAMHRHRVAFALEAQRGAPIATSHQRGRHLSWATAAHRPTDQTSHAARCISYRQQSYHVPALNKGDVIAVNEGKDPIDLAYLEPW